jgi:hypothetical protein
MSRRKSNFKIINPTFRTLHSTPAAAVSNKEESFELSELVGVDKEAMVVVVAIDHYYSNCSGYT